MLYLEQELTKSANSWGLIMSPQVVKVTDVTGIEPLLLDDLGITVRHFVSIHCTTALSHRFTNFYYALLFAI